MLWPMVVAFCVATLAAAVLMLGVRARWDAATGTAFAGLLLAACYAYGIARAVRWKWAVVWMMGMGSVVIALLPADVVWALAGKTVTVRIPPNIVGTCLLAVTFWGLLFLISGGISFWLYLRHTHAPAQETE